MSKNTDVVEPFFKCRECGCTEIEVTREYAKYNGVMESKRCTCGAAPSGLAAFRRFYTREILQDCGVLQPDHRIEYSAKGQEIFFTDGLEDPTVVICKSCFDGQVGRWRKKSYTEIVGLKYYVSCQNCQRSLEFGWSLPDCQGLIYPVECQDFDPSQYWPDPKYLYIWLRKKWLRKDFLKASA